MQLFGTVTQYSHRILAAALGFGETQVTWLNHILSSSSTKGMIRCTPNFVYARTPNFVCARTRRTSVYTQTPNSVYARALFFRVRSYAEVPELTYAKLLCTRV
jgi:hypothetical protein